MTKDASPLGAFVRGTWALLIVQFLVAVCVFGALTYASVRLNGILVQTAQKQAELRQLEDRLEQTSLNLANAREATSYVRDAINLFHAGEYDGAISNYTEALRLDPENAYVLDLLSYAHYMAARSGETASLQQRQDHITSAIAAIRDSLRYAPDSVRGYFSLAVYECYRGNEAASVEAVEMGLRQSPEALTLFQRRMDEIPLRCAALRAAVARSTP